MAQDAELDRLVAERDRAFRRKQEAWQTQDAARQRRSVALDAMDRAHAKKQAAYEVQDAAWRELQRVREQNGPRIESLNSRQATASQNGAASLTERRRLVQEIRDARNRHNNTKPAFHRANAHFDRTAVEHDRVKADHERTHYEFKRAEAEFDRARNAVRNRLRIVLAEQEALRDGA